VGRRKKRATARKRGNQAESKEGKKGKFIFLFQFFQSNFKISFECKFNSTWNLISNQTIQKDMQQHGCTHMIVNLHLILFLTKLLFS